MKRLAILAAILALSGAALAADIPDYVNAAVADTTRPEKQREVDVLRLPAETIAFSGVKPGDTVGELYPCGGYFTRMLSDVVGDKGKILGIETTRWDGCLDADNQVIEGGAHANVTFSANAFGEFTLAEPVDVFWITQNYHDLQIKEYGTVDIAAFNRKVFDALKPGGLYFIVDHQANAGTDEAGIAKLHRIEKDQVIREVTAAGFTLLGESDALHRTDDDHTQPVFDLKGKTDQYLLKFQKPAG